MRIQRIVRGTAVLFLSWQFGIAFGVDYIGPPCQKEESAKQDALKALNKCLKRTGRPPFNEKERMKSPLSICTKEVAAFEEAVTLYRKCLKPDPQPSQNSSPGTGSENPQSIGHFAFNLPVENDWVTSTQKKRVL